MNERPANVGPAMNKLMLHWHEYHRDQMPLRDYLGFKNGYEYHEFVRERVVPSRQIDHISKLIRLCLFKCDETVRDRQSVSTDKY